MKITAIVPIKMNNERLPGKNTKRLGEAPLVSYIQKTLLEVDEIADRYIFCSDDKICSYLLPGIHFLRRDPLLDMPTSNFTQIFETFMSLKSADIYVYAHATAPFISADTVKECVYKVKSGKYDSAFCAVKLQDYLWKDGVPLNFDASNLPRSQDLPTIYRETSGVYVFTKNVFEEYRRRIGINPFVKEVSFKESIDINTQNDFYVAEAFLNR